MGFNAKSNLNEIELAIYNLIKTPLAGVCDLVKTGSRNSSVNKPKMVYCNAPVPIVDLSAINSTTMRIEIYAEQIKGFKDSNTLTEIRSIILPLIEGGVTLDNSYFITLTNELGRPDGLGFDFLFLNLAVTVI